MKGILNLIIGGVFTLAATTSMAATMTSMDANWMCTTNASSATTDADKAADDKMANTASSGADAFAFASKNCRDCTKITCEAQSKDD
jgi:hypothetical protein